MMTVAGPGGLPQETPGAPPRDGTVLTALEHHAALRPQKTAIRFLGRGADVTAAITYADLVADAAAVAAGLCGRDLAGRAVVLALAPGIAFVIAFLACLRAGAIAVPVPFPPLGDNRRRLAALIGDACPAAILVEGVHDAMGPAPVIPLEHLARARAGWLPPHPRDGLPAVIQYSSGSTGAPRGIVLSHGNIAANARMIQAAFGAGHHGVGVSWLPPHHDMGLFGAIVQPLFVGGTAVLMPPFAFVQHPLRWLKAIERHEGSIAGGPNFGYDLCVRRSTAEQARSLDLSAWQLAFCGAEPVRAATLTRFAAHFAPARLAPGIFMPCYGLAEATLLVAAARRGQGAREVDVPGGTVLPRLSCGHAPPECRITIRDPDGPGILPDGMSGEICVAGPHVALGVWEGANGRIVDLPATAGPGVVRTGDLGVMTADGLVVLDRLKDVINAHGRAIHAIDVETAALGMADGSVLAAAAFAAASAEGEVLVLLCEVATADHTHGALRDLAARLSQGVGRSCGLLPRLEFVTRGALPRTSNGKIRRQAARQAFLAGDVRLLGNPAGHDG